MSTLISYMRKHDLKLPGNLTSRADINPRVIEILQRERLTDPAAVDLNNPIYGCES